MRLERWHNNDFVYQLIERWERKLRLDVWDTAFIKKEMEENIPCPIKIDGKLYLAPYKYWFDFIDAHGSCCGSCNEETLNAVDVAKKALIANSIDINEHSLEF